MLCFFETPVFRFALLPYYRRNEKSTSPFNDTGRTLIKLKDACIFWEYIKHNNDKKLILLQYETVIQKIKNKCESKDDLEFKRKLVVVSKIYQHLMQNTTMDITTSTYQKDAQNQDLNRSTILLFNSSQII